MSEHLATVRHRHADGDPREWELVHRLFEARADLEPEAAAVEFQGTTVSYAALDGAANRIAHRLVELGAGPGQLVAVCLERSSAMFAAVLAVLKCGAAYVPLDPSYPARRLQAMLADCRPSVVITDHAAATAVQTHSGVILDLDRERSQPSRAATNPLRVDVSPRAPAYVIYTSGSTGSPKGVVVPHGGVGNLANVTAREFGTGPGVRVLQFSSFSFDAWVAELAMSLLTGATLVLASRDQLADPAALHEVLASRRIAVVTLPPSVLARLDPDGLPDLRTVCAAGERCSWELGARWQAPGRRFINGYGPTEVTVAACYHRIRDARTDAASVPIGAPIANKRAYVVDTALRPVPRGQPGELLVGGVGIALGYLRRPELTAARFIADPFSDEPGARAYRTGDVVRWLPDGVLEFLERVDDQVALHGFRIELGEIDAALRGHPNVRDAVTTVREDHPGQQRLVAYAVGDLGARELRAHLRQRLPEWMVPSAIVVLDGLPLTPSGKVDKRALPAPAPTGLQYVSPRTPLERTIAAVFAEVLRCGRVGADDGFFDLGGDSLLATQAASRLTNALGYVTAPSMVLDAPTPAELAEAIVRRIALGLGEPLGAHLRTLSRHKRMLLEQRLLTAAGRADLQQIPRRSAGDPAPLSFSQRRLWFIDQLRPGGHTYNAALPMIVRGFVDPLALRRALDAVIARHEVMRTIYPVGSDGNPRQVVLPTAHVELTVRDLSSLPRVERTAAAVAELRREARRPFDLAQDLTTRAVVVRLDEDEHALAIVSHHICCDGWSRDVLLHEFAAFYEAFLTGANAELPELPIQYADYAIWQHQWLSGAELERQLGYWRHALDGAPHTLDMATDRPRPHFQSFRGARHWFSVPAELTMSLTELSRAQRATLYQTLLAGYEALIFARSGQCDFLIGSPIANRQRLEVESLVGFFSNTLVVRAEVSASESFRELIARVRRTTLGGYAHQDLPFEKLVEALRPPRDPSRNPLVQTNFRAQAVPPPQLSLAGSPVEPLELDLATARFDFAIDLCAEDTGSLRGYLEYNTDLFDQATAIHIAEDYVSLLSAAAGTPDVPLRELEPLERLIAS